MRQGQHPEVDSYRHGLLLQFLAASIPLHYLAGVVAVYLLEQTV